MSTDTSTKPDGPQVRRRFNMNDWPMLGVVIVAVLILGLLAGTWFTFSRYPDLPEGESSSSALLRAQLQQSERYQEALLQTVYFMLGTTIVVLLALIAYGWFQNRVLFDLQREELQRFDKRLTESDARQRQSEESLQTLVREGERILREEISSGDARTLANSYQATKAVGDSVLMAYSNINVSIVSSALLAATAAVEDGRALDALASAHTGLSIIRITEDPDLVRHLDTFLLVITAVVTQYHERLRAAGANSVVTIVLEDLDALKGPRQNMASALASKIRGIIERPEASQ